MSKNETTLKQSVEVSKKELLEFLNARALVKIPKGAEIIAEDGEMFSTRIRVEKLTIRWES